MHLHPPAVTADREHDGNLDQLRSFFTADLGQSDDFRIREFRLGGADGHRVLLAYIEGMIDEQGIEDRVISPLMKATDMAKASAGDLAYLADVTLTTRPLVRRDRRLGAAEKALLEGGVAVFFEGCTEFLIVGATGYPTRGIEKPQTEHAVLGPREGFTESLTTSLTQVRRRINHQGLRVKVLEVGVRSRTKVAVLHLEEVCNPEVVAEVVGRLQRIEIDHLQGPGMVMEFLNDHPWTPFPMLRTTERPDEAVRQLMEGKAVILVEGNPFAISAPSVLMDFYQTMDDYHFSYWAASAVRLIRIVGWMLALFLPAFYIALIAVNPEMVPNELALTISGAREGLPFPPVLEVLIIEILIELIREAALRLPQPLGNTIGVVGGIVVGQAIVQAGLVSPLIIISAATTMLASFTSPTLDIGFTWRLLKWVLIILANMFGLVGVIVGTTCIFAHMAALSSFGVPYLAPFGSPRLRDLGDTLVRMPFFLGRRRPAYLHPLDEKRKGPFEHPEQFPDLTQAERPQWEAPK